MATATRPRVRKKLAEVGSPKSEVGASGVRPPVRGLAAEVTIEKTCPQCERPFWVFKGHEDESPVCASCLANAADGDSAADDNLLPPAVAELLKEADPDRTKPESKSSSAAAVDRPARMQRMALDLIARNRFNPRQDFPREELEELAGSLKADGQLQPVVVRRLPATPFLESIGDRNRIAEFEIVAGERRALAAKLAKWAEIDVIVRECDDATAAKLAIEENRQRRDISQVEFARGIQRRMELAGLDVAGVAEDLKLDVSTVRNLFRLLEAPEAWQRRVISREISGTHLRHALPYLHAPAIEAALAKHVDEAVKEEGRLSESEKKWQRTIEDVVRAKGVTLYRSVQLREPTWQSGQVSIDKKHPQYAELDVVTLKSPWGGIQSYALNAKLANSILSEKAKAWKAKRASAGKPSGKGKAPSAAELKKQAESAKAAKREALKDLLFDWRCWLCAEAIAKPEQEVAQELAVLTGGLAISTLFGDVYDCGQAAAWSVWPRVPKFSRELGARWLAATAAERCEVILRAARSMFWDAKNGCPGMGEWARNSRECHVELMLWCERLQIDLAAAWRAKNEDGSQAMCGPLTDRFFELLTEAELEELAFEWKIAISDKDSQTDLLTKLRRRPERVLPLPKMLADIAGKIKKRKAK